MPACLYVNHEHTDAHGSQKVTWAPLEFQASMMYAHWASHGFEVILLHIGSLGQLWGGHPSRQKIQKQKQLTKVPRLNQIVLPRAVWSYLQNEFQRWLFASQIWNFPHLSKSGKLLFVCQFSKMSWDHLQIWSHFSRHWRLQWWSSWQNFLF